jgi:hypothetical protein
MQKVKPEPAFSYSPRPGEPNSAQRQSAEGAMNPWACSRGGPEAARPWRIMVAGTILFIAHFPQKQ